MALVISFLFLKKCFHYFFILIIFNFFLFLIPVCLFGMPCIGMFGIVWPRRKNISGPKSQDYRP
jgi:hypothetical protein